MFVGLALLRCLRVKLNLASYFCTPRAPNRFDRFPHALLNSHGSPPSWTASTRCHSRSQLARPRLPMPFPQHNPTTRETDSTAKFFGSNVLNKCLEIKCCAIGQVMAAVVLLCTTAVDAC